MKRLTAMSKNGTFTVDARYVETGEGGVCFGEAIERLARFENLCENLIREQDLFSERLEELRREEKTRSVKFRELLGKKLINTQLLSILDSNGLLEK